MNTRILLSVIAIGMCPMVAGADLASVGYVTQTQDVINAQILTKADNDDVVHKTGDENITGVKTFSDGIVLDSGPDDSANDNTVPTTAWTNTHINNAKGQVPVGSATSDIFVDMWMEE